MKGLWGRLSSSITGCILNLSKDVDWSCDYNSISFDLKRLSAIAEVAFYHHMILIRLFQMKGVVNLSDCAIELDFLVKVDL